MHKFLVVHFLKVCFNLCVGFLVGSEVATIWVAIVIVQEITSSQVPWMDLHMLVWFTTGFEGFLTFFFDIQGKVGQFYVLPYASQAHFKVESLLVNISVPCAHMSVFLMKWVYCKVYHRSGKALCVVLWWTLSSLILAALYSHSLHAYFRCHFLFLSVCSLVTSDLGVYHCHSQFRNQRKISR